MALDRFSRAVAHVFEADGGGSRRAKFGISQKTYDDWRATAGQSRRPVSEMDEAEAREILKRVYWDKVGGDDLPEALSVMMMDAAVDLGAREAVQLLQTMLNSKFNARPALATDGVIGPKTLRAVEQAPGERVLDEFVVQRGLRQFARSALAAFDASWARRLLASARRAYAALDRALPRGDTDGPGDEPAPVQVDRYFWAGRRAQTYGTFFRLWGGWATAAHVLEEMGWSKDGQPDARGALPPYASGEVKRRFGGLDAALIGAILPPAPPPEPFRAQPLVAIGFPAGAARPAKRRAKAYMKRPRDTVWIAQIYAPAEPVVVGMSGGAVFDERTGAVVGVLVHRNSPADLDQDGALDQSFDFVALSDIYAAVRAGRPVDV